MDRTTDRQSDSNMHPRPIYVGGGEEGNDKSTIKSHPGAVLLQIYVYTASDSAAW